MPTENSRERRQQIARALLTVMSQHGYVGATIKKIANEADLSPGLVHYHFDSKQQILLQLVEDLGTTPVQTLDAIALSPASPAAKLRAVIDSFLATGDTADPDLVSAWVVVTGEAVRQSEVAQAFHSVVARCQNTIADIVREGTHDQTFDLGQENPTEIAAGLMATIQGYYTFAATSRDLVPPGSAARVAAAFIRSLSRETPGEPRDP